jgi:hypothetical protein
MKQHRFLLFAIVFLLVFQMAHAADPQLKFSQVNTSIFKSEQAIYEVTITNEANFIERFQIYSHSARFVVQVEPKAETVPIDPYASKVFRILVTPKEVVGVGPYGVPIKIESLVTKSIFETSLPINIKDTNATPGLYPPNPVISVIIPTKIDPRDSMRVDVQLKNRNPRDLKDVTVTIESPLFAKTYTTTLGGMEEKGNELIFDLSHLEIPGKYKLTAKVIFEGKSYAEEVKNFEILRYYAVDNTTRVQKELFKTTTTYDFVNNGNAKEEIEKRVGTTFFRNFFITEDPAATKMREGGKAELVWTFSLQPTETMSIVTVENYRIPVFVIAVIIVLIIIYFLVRSPIVCNKDVHLTPTKEGVSDIKVKILVKNRTSLRLSNIRVIDRIPGIAELVHSEKVGTLNPTKVIRDSKRGIIVRFDLHQLDPFEERIITYNIKSKLKIIGGLSLDPAKVKFETSKGIERKTYSNAIDIKTRRE